jgi:hypothetical protein
VAAVERLAILEIEATRSSPDVRLDSESRVLRISGQSYPENAFKFYEPVLEWVDRYLAASDPAEPTVVELALPYVNTSSAKCLMLLFDRLESAYEAGRLVEVRWYYNEDHERELECAEDFKEDLTLPFQTIPRKEELA